MRLAEPYLERCYHVGIGNSATARPRLKTEHFDIYVEKGSLAETRVEAIGRQREEALAEIEKLLGIIVRERIPLVFYGNAATKTRETGHTGVGLASNGMIIELCNNETQLDPFHELAHIIGHLIGDPPALFNEGFAVYISECLGAQPLHELGHPNRTVDQVACDLSKAGELLPLNQLFGYTEIGSEESHWRISYAEAASVVEYLVNTAGLDRFRQAYAQLRCSGDSHDLDLNHDKFKRIFGQSLAEVEKGWRHHLCTPSE